MAEPTYKANYDIKCQCDETVIECEWIWDDELECWICTDCAVVQ